MEKNYYDILEVNKNASQEIIEKAYKTLVKKYHPDLQDNNLKNEYEEKNNILELIELLGNRKKFFFRNFWSGIIKGIGTGIGFTILTAILLVVLQKIVALNLPVISEYILDIIEIVKIKML